MDETKVAYEEVAEHADAILARGELPSVLCIRGLMSHVTASNDEIAFHLLQWRKQQLAEENSPQKTQLLEAMQLEDDIAQKTDDLQFSKALVYSTLEATADGIMVVDKDGHLVNCNQKFVKMWGIPMDLIEAGDEQKALAHVMEQMVEPEKFYQMVTRTYSTLEDKNELDEVAFKDGRIFELYSQAHRVHHHIVGRVWSARDVTQRRRDEESIRVRQSAIEASPNGILIIKNVGDEKRVVYANTAYKNIIACAPDESINGSRWDMLERDQETNKVAIKELELAFSNHSDARVELEWFHKDATRYWCELYVAPVSNIKDHYVGILSDITEQKLLEQQLTHQATHDALTNLPNRLMLLEHLKQAMIQCKKMEKILSLLFIDLDRFKLVNDSYGHDLGDALLREVGIRLKSFVRESDIVARLGGDEFVIVLSMLEKQEEALPIVDSILKSLGEPFKLLEGIEAEILLTPSVGISFFPEDSDNAKNLLKNADIAMYQAKEKGRNTFVVFNATMNSQLKKRVKIEQDLRHAIERGEFVLNLQPIVNLNTLKISGFEALIRWQHPEDGLVSPLEFIPVAEETGLIIPIGDWVIQTVCEVYSDWQKHSFPDVTIAVNVSGRQFKEPGFSDRVKEIIKKTGVNPSFLNFEVTESLLIDDIEKVLKILMLFRKLSIKISIDDFGTGYSSLNYLKLFPVNKIKIDRGFVRDLREGDSNSAIIQAIIAIAKNLKMSVVAEGIEEASQLQFLQALLCEEGQGYYFSRPVGIPEATQLLKRGYFNKPAINKTKQAFIRSSDAAS